LIVIFNLISHLTWWCTQTHTGVNAVGELISCCELQNTCFSDIHAFYILIYFSFIFTTSYFFYYEKKNHKALKSDKRHEKFIKIALSSVIMCVCVCMCESECEVNISKRWKNIILMFPFRSFLLLMRWWHVASKAIYLYIIWDEMYRKQNILLNPLMFVLNKS
jgi:hypothetical protein